MTLEQKLFAGLGVVYAGLLAAMENGIIPPKYVAYAGLAATLIGGLLKVRSQLAGPPAAEIPPDPVKSIGFKADPNKELH